MARPLATAYLDGDYLPLNEARISPLDRGFLFGDGVYEVIPVYAGRLFRFEEHLRRLAYSLDAIRLPDPYSAARWREVLDGLVARNGGGMQSIYLQITRGADTGRDHRFPANVAPTVFALSQELAPVPEAWLTGGVAVVAAEDIRWQRCDIKATALLGNILLRQQAEDTGAAETLLIRDGCVTEGSSSTLFVVTADGVVRTPPKDNRLLPGITRDLILELARGAGLACEEAEIPATDLASFPEIWIASSSREVLAVTRLNGAAVGYGHPGPIWQQVHALFQRYKKNLAAND
ncbi:MAG TPA: D-amino acid aminotransferase [Gammaproteobacteria bacterium]|nr:D-amino acid aminotransferase [Gammaproteobacteria bacterium]